MHIGKYTSKNIVTGIVACLVADVALAQCPVVVGGSDFTDIAHSDTVWVADFNATSQTGPSGNKFSSSFAFADSAIMLSGSEPVYAITSNPNLLNDSDYVDVDKNMFIISTQKTANTPNEKYFGYRINGLEKGSSFSVKAKIYNLMTDSSECATANPWAEWGVRAMVNPDAYGQTKVSETVKLKKPADGQGTYSELLLTGKLDASVDFIDFQVWPNYNLPECAAIGITDLEIQGCYKPKVKSNMGIEMCRGEQTLISLDKEYNASSYEWFKSTDGGKTFASIGTKKNVYEQVKEENVQFFCLVNGIPSDTLDLKTIVFCVDDQGNPMSRMDVFYDDFGHFEDMHTYVDAFGNQSTTPTTWAPMRADVTFTMPSVMTYDASGGINDGNYGVVVPTATGYYQDPSGNSTATWMAGVSSDHTSMVTGESYGGALFMNVAYSYCDVIFSRQIDGLCKGKNIYFETYIANMSGGTNPEVTINIKDAVTGKVLESNRQVAYADAGWIRCHIDKLELPENTTSVILEVVSTGGQGTSGDSFWREGNDLVIDDIRFMVCSPPSVDAYSDMNSFASDTLICANSEFTMGAPVSDLLKSFFKGKERFLYQQSEDGKNWNNMSSITADNTYTFSTEPYKADTNYFRVVVATEEELKQFVQDPSSADFTDKCRSYSISKPFKVVRAGAIDMGKDAEYDECGGTELTLKGSNDGTLVKWGWSTKAGDVLVPTSSDEDAKTYTYKVTDDETLVFTGYNKEGCNGKRTFTIRKKETVDFALDSAFICGKTTFTATGYPAGAVFAWEYADAELTENGSKMELDTTNAEGGVLKVSATLKGYCNSDTVEHKGVRIMQFPAKPVNNTATKAVEFVSEPGSEPIADAAEVTDKGNTLYWYTKSDLSDPNVQAPLQDKSTAGTYYYYATQENADGCMSDSVKITVVVNETPAPKTKDAAICSQSTLSLDDLVEKTAGFQLQWYRTADQKAETPTSNAPAFTETAPGVYTYYVSNLNTATNVESTLSPINVTVYGVDLPEVMKPETTYCADEPNPVSLADMVAENADLTKYLGSSGLKWFDDKGVELKTAADLIPGTAAKSSKTVTYKVRQYFTVPGTNEVCDYPAQFKTVDINISVADAPAGDFAVNYLKTDGNSVSGYKDLMEQSGGAVAVAAAGCSLNWYDENKNPLPAAPSPAYIDNQVDDRQYTYYVSQTNANGCESEMKEVTVNVSSTPLPVGTNVAFCEDKDGSFTPDALTAKIVTTGANDSESNYELVWCERCGSQYAQPSRAESTI